MQDSQIPIERYLAELAIRLEMPAEERATSLLEARVHLEELAATYRAEGADDLTAQRLAVETFGDVRRLGRQLSSGHVIHRGGRRWARGIVLGALVSWAIWIIGTFPVMADYFASHEPVHPPSMMSILMQSTPLASGAFYAYLTFGWIWLLPLLFLYALPPFLWGRHAQRWRMPGLAYGLGTWLAIPWGVAYWFLWNTGDWAYQAESNIVLLALPLAVVASLAGWLWRTQAEDARIARVETAA